MKAIVVSRCGGPDVLELREVPEPQPTAEKGQVLVDVEAIGVNFADTVQTQGMYPNGPKPPYVPGLEFAGTVHGTQQRVMGFTHSGAYAEKLIVSKASLLPVAENWSAAEAAAFPVNYFTAYFAYWMAGLLDRGQPTSRKRRVLIHAVAGGVGTASVEMGKLLGIEMFGTASSDDKLRQVKTLGLHHGINYKIEDYAEAVAKITNGEGVDAVFEMLGGEHTARSTRCLRELGRIIIYGMASGQAPHFDFMTMFQKNLSAHALWLSPLAANQQLMGEAWGRLSEWIKTGGLKPIIGTQLPLERAAEAHLMLLERRNYGKVVLTV